MRAILSARIGLACIAVVSPSRIYLGIVCSAAFRTMALPLTLIDGRSAARGSCNIVAVFRRARCSREQPANVMGALMSSAGTRSRGAVARWSSQVTAGFSLPHRSIR
jgi:hypothetical protein